MRFLKTDRGLPLDEAISALQKEIRRGEERKAYVVALEMLPRYEKYLWRRLLVITMEDISIGNPNAHLHVRSLRDSYFEFRGEGKTGTARHALANAILIMCRSSKTRIADHLQCVASVEHHKGVAVISDYAVDKHTARGRQMGRDPKHWLDEGCRLIPAAPIDDPHATEAQDNWIGGWKGPDWGKLGNGKAKEDQADPGMLF